VKSSAMDREELAVRLYKRAAIPKAVAENIVGQVLAIIQEGVLEGGFYAVELGGIYPYQSGGKPHGASYIPSNAIVKGIRATTRGGPPPEPPEDSRASTGDTNGKGEGRSPDPPPNLPAPEEGAHAGPSLTSRNGRRPSEWLRGSSPAPESPPPSAPRRHGDDQRT